MGSGFSKRLERKIKRRHLELNPVTFYTEIYENVWLHD